MKGIIAIALLVFSVSAASALDLHADKRFASASCFTWGSGKYRAVSAIAQVKTTWDGTSNYPVGQEVKFDCKYVDEAIPVSSGGIDTFVCGNCYAKTVIPKGETMPKTSWPTLTIGVTNDYNTGQTFQQCWCKWDPWAYGATPVPK
jgi:hypothetical protein